MLRASRRRRYFLAWRMFQEEIDEETAISRDLRNRSLLRQIINPMDINEVEFIKQYRLSKDAVTFLCAELAEKTELRPSKRVSLEHKVMCALSFYATGSYQRIVGQSKHVGHTTVSLYVTEVTNALNHPAITNSFIKFPTTREQRGHIMEGFYDKFGFPGCIGCIDGSHFHIVTPHKDIEHHFYCHKHFHSVNVQVVCDSEYRILNINPKYGGAAHDAFIWSNSAVNNFMQDLDRNNEQVWLLGDSGYPLRPWLMTPITDAHEDSPEGKYTYVHGETRVVVENTFGRLKNRWRCVGKDRTLHYKPEKCAQIITACCVLHNLAMDFGVPDPIHEEIAGPYNGFQRNKIVEDDEDLDDLARGRAIRRMLVQRINSLHQ